MNIRAMNSWSPKARNSWLTVKIERMRQWNWPLIAGLLFYFGFLYIAGHVAVAGWKGWIYAR